MSKLSVSIESEHRTTLIRPLRKFLKDLASDIASEDLESLAFLLKFSDDAQFNKPIDLFRVMMRKRMLTEKTVKELADLFTEIGRNDLSKKVEEYIESTVSKDVWCIPTAILEVLSSSDQQSLPKSSVGNVFHPENEAEQEDQLEVDFPSDKETLQSTPSTAVLAITAPVVSLDENSSEPKRGTMFQKIKTVEASDKPDSSSSDSAQVNSFLEKFRKRIALQTSEKAGIQLHAYQIELARPGLEGRNCIICAPTGCGKTMTAGFICREQRRIAKKDDRRFKALFIVAIRNLIEQQKDALSLIATKGNGAELAVCGIGETNRLSDCMRHHDVTVLTAQILVNCLTTREVTLYDLDLLIMDECHHTTLSHPYNIIMQEYLKAKRADPYRRLPQVIGLTASLGVGSSADDPTLHYIQLCASLDCSSVTHVRENLDELLKFSPRPKKDQIISVEPRHPQNLFYEIIKLMMGEVQEMVEFPLKSQRQPEGTQQYENWVVDQKREAERRGLQDVITVTETLRKLNVALMIYDDLRAKDAKECMDEHFGLDYLPQVPSEIASRILRLYREDVSPKLVEIVRKEDFADNAKLKTMCNLLTALFRADSDARGILLTRTRYGVDALYKFIREIPQLKTIVYPARLVGQGRKEGTMTDVEQENTLRLFRLGRDVTDGCNLLVATDVAQEGLDMPKCNFVIRYNFVSNEIGTVQSKGRARAPDSECYLIVSRGSVNEKREYENLEKEYLMIQALDKIDAIPPSELQELIRQEQESLWKKFQQKAEDRKSSSQVLDAQKVSIYCRNCTTMLCNATEMRRKLQNYICIATDLSGKIFTKKNARPSDFRLDTHIGVFHCKNPGCNKKLGPHIQYKQGQRQIGYAFSKESVMWRYEGEEEYRQIKQWSKVPFPIEED